MITPLRCCEHHKENYHKLQVLYTSMASACPLPERKRCRTVLLRTHTMLWSVQCASIIISSGIIAADSQCQLVGVMARCISRSWPPTSSALSLSCPFGTRWRLRAGQAYKIHKTSKFSMYGCGKAEKRSDPRFPSCLKVYESRLTNVWGQRYNNSV